MATFTIGGTIIGSEIATARFACELSRCRGACCTLPGGRGAPVDGSELEDLNRATPLVRKYLSPEHLQVIDKTGVVEGAPGGYVTVCVSDRECVFVFYDQGIARCAFEKAFYRGEIPWRKPISCHLFPIRITGHYTERLRSEPIPECAPALGYGIKNNIYLFEFAKDALVRKYGKSWYDELSRKCIHSIELGRNGPDFKNVLDA